MPGDLGDDRSIDIDLLEKLACNPHCDIWIIRTSREPQNPSSRHLGSCGHTFLYRIGMVRALWRGVVELPCPHYDRHRTAAQRGSLFDRNHRRNRGQLRVGLALRKTTCRARPHRIEDRARVLVRFLVCPIREHLRVLSVRNKSLAAHSHKHGPALSRLRH
jgi:hypothetical protein